MTDLFEAFNRGHLILPNKTLNFENVPWSKHPTFDGVELKHIVTSVIQMVNLVIIWFGLHQTKVFLITSTNFSWKPMK